MGLLKAIQWASDSGCLDVTFELDCKMVVGQIYADKKDVSEFGAIISLCKTLLDINPTYEVVFVSRQGNLAAHTTVIMAVFFPSPHIFNVISTCIADIIANDMK